MSAADFRQARVIARACQQHAAKRTGDIDTMRAAAIELHDTYRPASPQTATDQHGTEESPR